jgi:hypothetical protein
MLHWFCLAGAVAVRIGSIVPIVTGVIGLRAGA